MHQPTSNPILDYASPRPRTQLRLPAQSVAVIRWDPDRRGVRIVERVGAIPVAIGGMIFALFVLLVLGAVTFDLAYGFGRHRWRIDEQVTLLSGIWLLEAVLLVMVAAQTWRRTILAALDGELALIQSGLFGRKEHRWRFDDIANMEVVATQTAKNEHALAELQFRAAGTTPVHLFTDHPIREVMEIYDALRRVVHLEVKH